MIIEWILSFSLLWVFPSLLAFFNPFFLPVSNFILERKSLPALLTAYITGLLRDLFLATPRFGMLGSSSLFSTLIALSVCFYFSFEGFLGTCFVMLLLTLCDLFISIGFGFYFYGHLFFSWKMPVYALLFSFLWVVLVKGIPQLFHLLLLRRRRRDSNS